MSLENDQDSKFHCSAVYHLLRLKGKGARLLFPLYDLSMALGYKSERFFASIRDAAPFFDCHESELYAAAKMLVDNDWWDELDHGYGRPNNYQPVGHDAWVKLHPGQCCEKLPAPWDGEEQDKLGKELFAVTGGVTFYPQVLAGWRKLGMPDNVIVMLVQEFAKSNPRPAKRPRAFAKYRRLLGEFLRSQSESK